MPLTKDRSTPTRNGGRRAFPVKANTTIFAGALVALNAGLAVPASATAGLVVVGRAEGAASTAGAGDGAATITTARGVFAFENQANDLVARTDIGQSCYVVDDCTVAKTDNNGARPVAGRVFDVDDAGVWVEII